MMDIVTATKEALIRGVGITNDNLKSIKCYLLPTNTSECYLVIPDKYTHKGKRKVATRWNPRAADILAYDWELRECERKGVQYGEYELVYDDESGDYVVCDFESGQVSLLDEEE